VNYRHAYHAGNYADVLKHALLVRLIRLLQRKDTGFLFLDTHAGRGRYDLSEASRGDSLEREPEWPGGIGRLWGRADAPPAVAEYLALMRSFDRSQGNLAAEPRFYPGSPRIAALLARPQDRLEFWEAQGSECAALRHDVDRTPGATVREGDGFGAIKASLPPRERRALVLVDPPYEAADEGQAVARAVKEGLKRLPDAVLALWYPLTARALPQGGSDWIERGKTPALAVELVVDPDAPRMTGCGVAVLNPPWTFDAEARSIAAYLADAVGRGPKAQGSVRWIVPEEGSSAGTVRT
jgi:23S rRNA (adenine2030-N6)-methyltransferase